MRLSLSRRELINAWIAITLAASIVAFVDGGFTAHWLALAPARIWRGEIWRLATWIFVEQSPMSLVFTCAAIYKFGGELAPRWGTRRLVRFIAEIVLAAAVVTALVALVAPRTYLTARCGGWVVPDVLVIAWARQYPSASLTLYYGMLTVRGRDLVRITVGVTVLYALASHPLYLVPELVAVCAAALYPQPRLERL